MSKTPISDTNDEHITEDKEFMLSTLDNPYNPFTNFDEWYNFDCMKGYYSCSYLGRVFESMHEPYLSDKQKSKLIQKAIQSILDNDVSGIFCKVSKDEVVKPIELN